MNKLKIFEDGYLKPEFINKSYRGLIGWPCVNLGENEDDNLNGVLLHINKSVAYTADNMHFSLHWKTFKIPQFTPKDIPIGELVWWHNNTMRFKNNPIVFSKTMRNFMNQWLILHNHCPIVPYIIAETPERAEQLKDWWK